MTPVRELRVWRLHPMASGIRPADPTLGGAAPLSARQYCGPYMHANGAGFLVFSPIDIDLSYDPDREFPWEWEIHGEGYDDAEVDVFRAMPVRHEHFRPEMHKRRTKIFLSGNDTEPKDTAQLWTGCIFETPPGWALLVRSPINRELDAPFRVQEGILECDWLHYDIWLNLEFHTRCVTAKLRRDGPPIAQLLPITREAYQRWTVNECPLRPEDPRACAIFDAWVDYTWEKFHSLGDGVRDRATYHRQRQRHRDGPA
jgi:hypothetical protein